MGEGGDERTAREVAAVQGQVLEARTSDERLHVRRRQTLAAAARDDEFDEARAAATEGADEPAREVAGAH